MARQPVLWVVEIDERDGRGWQRSTSAHLTRREAYEDLPWWRDTETKRCSYRVVKYVRAER